MCLKFKYGRTFEEPFYKEMTSKLMSNESLGLKNTLRFSALRVQAGGQTPASGSRLPCKCG